MSTAVQDRLDFSTATKDEVGYVKSYLKIPSEVTEDDTLIDNIITATKEDIDTYLHNDFEEVRPQVIVDSPNNGESVTIDGITFTVASSTSVEDREFADAAGLVSCVNSKLVTVNGDPVGIKYLTASNDSGTVTLKPDSGHVEKVEVYSSDESNLKVQRKIFEKSIPENIKDGALKLIAYRYYKRTGGLESENSEHGGSGSKSWAEVKREFLQPYRSMNV